MSMGFFLVFHLHCEVRLHSSASIEELSGTVFCLSTRSINEEASAAAYSGACYIEHASHMVNSM